MIDFIFDEFFMNASVYTVEFVAPNEHSDLLSELIQRLNNKCISVLVQQDRAHGFILSFVSVYSIGEFHKWLLVAVNSMHRKYGLRYSQFHYL